MGNSPSWTITEEFINGKKQPPLEKDFQTAVLKKLRLIPKSEWFKLNDRVTVGLPDIVGACNGWFVALELKTRSKIAPIQAYTLRKIGNAKGHAFIVTPDNWDGVYAFLLELSVENPTLSAE